jgi:transposase
MAREKKSLIPHLQPVPTAETAPPVAQDLDVAAKAPPPSVPPVDSEVPLPRRRSFTAEFKRKVLAEVDACTEPGGIGALLRRHGLYSSHLSEWRRQRDAGELSGLAPKKRGRKAVAKNPLVAEVARLEREVKRLTARAERAEGLVAVQKKLAELLGEELPSEEELLEAERRGLPIPPPRKKR